MNKRNVTNLPASVHHRLLNLAKETQRPFNELLQYYTMERFLFRLSHSPFADRFVLKGALMLRVWDLSQARPTMDIDLLGRAANTVENLVEIIRQCLSVEVAEDGIQFDPGSVLGEPITVEKKYQGVRVRVRGTLGNARLSLQLDFGFGDVVVPGPVWIDYPQLLDFGPPHLLGYTPESVIAEKFQALVELELANTRLKDFFDLWKLSQTLTFDSEILMQAITATFKQRGTPLPTTLPLALTEAFYDDPNRQAQWNGFLRRGRLEAEAKPLADIALLIAEFLLPLTQAAATNSPFKKHWLPGGNWQ
ncbi:MAG: nucleotidyl transferase AbiEii/AbiGii toxin family protein [Acidobacteria bacterium]|nr:nucleotidyl transferase AbiEii/AbiGii toxin family protein [Acidobacteriota bacterium]